MASASVRVWYLYGREDGLGNSILACIVVVDCGILMGHKHVLVSFLLPFLNSPRLGLTTGMGWEGWII